MSTPFEVGNVYRYNYSYGGINLYAGSLFDELEENEKFKRNFESALDASHHSNSYILFTVVDRKEHTVNTTKYFVVKILANNKFYTIFHNETRDWSRLRRFTEIKE